MSHVNASDLVTVDTNIDDLIEQFPGVASVFVRHRMACVGCDLARFDSVADACQWYGVAPATLLAEIREVIERPVAGRRTLPGRDKQVR